ncbi:MAG: hypothetical protein LAO20_15785 [Acidobacteriia bacterium]|nr:hypothetical protein [Terriglobia bacterium]
MKSLWKIVVILGLVPALFAQPPAKSADQSAKKDAPEQESKASSTENFYKLSFVISEAEDGKRINQREYSMIRSTSGGPPATIRVSTRVPIYVEEKKLQYIDAGLELRCWLKEPLAGKLPVQCDINISNFVLEQQFADPKNSAGPMLRTASVSTGTVVIPGKPTILSTIDDVNSKKRTQIEVTVTKVD